VGVGNYFKALSQATRELAIHGRQEGRHTTGIRSKSRLAFFLASTLSRAATLPPPPKEEIHRLVLEAIDRITTPSPMPTPDVLERLGEFIKRVIKPHKNPDRFVLPVPHGKGCYERPGRQGGATYVYKEHATLTTDEELALIMEEESESLRQRALRLGHSWADVELNSDAELHRAVWHQELRYQHGGVFVGEEYATTPWSGPHYAGRKVTGRRRRTLAQMFYASNTSAPGKNKARALPIIQRDGKIRVATLHQADVLWASRAMTSWILPTLNGLAFSRDMLNARPTRLRSDQRDTYLYSADLSKSTDPISIPLSRFVLDKIVEITGKPTWWDNAVKAVITDFQLTYDGKQFTTTCGALMGLGPGWTVLSILNAWAAEDAGAKRGSYTVCGDDLIGLWTKSTIERYEANLISLSLVPNRAKSYISRTHGIFCERLIQRTGLYTAGGAEVIRIAEATGASALHGQNGRAVLDHLKHLRCHKVLSAAAKRVYQRLTLKSPIPGDLGEGGSGKGSANSLTVLSYALAGPIALTYGETNPEYQAFKNKLRTLPGSPTGRPARDLLVDAHSALEAAYRRENGKKTEPRRRRPGRHLNEELTRRLMTINRLLKANKNSPILALRAILRESPYVRTRATLSGRVEAFLRRGWHYSAVKELQRSWNVRLEVSGEHSLVYRLLGVDLERLQLNNLQPVHPRRDSRAGR
jgi:hypothetical protein